MEEMNAQIEDLFENLKKKKNNKAKNSKQKGSRGELQICKILTNHFGEPFNRSPNSGAFGSTHKMSAVATQMMASDVLCPESFKFSIESKAGYDIDLSNLFVFNKKKCGDMKKITGFVDQACRDAARCEKVPMVIYLKDYRPSLAILPAHEYSGVDTFMKKLVLFNACLLFNHEPKNIKNWKRWVIVSFEELLSLMSKDFFYAV